MQTIKVNTYSYKELSKEAKEKARKTFSDINVDYDGWADMEIEGFEGELDNLGYDNAKILYEGFGSQGNGACFTATINIEKWLKAHKLLKKFKLLADNEDNITISIIHNSRYCYSTSTEIETENWVDYSEKKREKIYRQIDEVEELIKEEREELGNKLYTRLEDAYFELLSDKAVEETIIINEYRFTKDGDSKCYL